MEIKYEAVFGDQSLFDNDIGDSVAAINHGDVVFCFNSYSAFLIEVMKCNDLPLSDIPEFAMRRIIRTPIWTVEDQKAGKLPDVGAEFKARGYVWECVRILNNTILAVVGDSYCGFDIDECKPIESPEEKAARLRMEWCNEAGAVCSLGMTTLTRIYDALLSGELPMPGKE